MGGRKMGSSDSSKDFVVRFFDSHPSFSLGFMIVIGLIAVAMICLAISRLFPYYWSKIYGFRTARLCRKGMCGKALEYIDGVIKRNPNNYSLFFFKASVFEALKNYDECLQNLDRALAIRPYDVDTLNEKSKVLGILGIYDWALYYNNIAMSVNPGNYNILVNRGNILVDVGRYDEALKCYEVALNISPDLIYLLFMPLMIYMLLRGKGKEACLYGKGVAFFRMKRYNEAVYNLKKYIKHVRRDIRAYKMMAAALSHLAMYKEQLKVYDAIIRLDSRDARACYEKGITLCNIAHFSEASASFDMASRIDPSFADAVHGFQVFEGASATRISHGQRRTITEDTHQFQIDPPA
jgi:tetratricopeptide (TPR) repeat protein